MLSGLRGSGELVAPDLVPFQPALGRLVPGWHRHDRAPGIDSPVVLAEGVLRLLRVLAGGRGCLLVLEDLQWADLDTLAVLEYLADNVAAEQVVCVATVRSGAVGDGVETMRELVGRRTAHLVELARLDEEASICLAQACMGGAKLPEALAAFVARSTDGLPFLIEELLAELVGDGVLVERHGHWSTVGHLEGRVPRTFAAGVAQRLDQMSTDGRAVLRAAAVLGRRFDWSLLSEISAVDEAGIIVALRDAVAAQLLVEDEEGFCFRHALTRDAVLGDMVGPERSALAGRALRSVERAHPDAPGTWCWLAAELAEAAGDRSHAARLLTQASSRASAAGALGTARVALERARALVPDDPDLTVPIDEALTDVLALAGDVDRAFEVGSRLLGRLDLASRLPAAGAELHVRLARAAVAAGRWQVAAEHLAAVRRAPSSTQVADGGALDALGAQVALGEGRLPEADRLAYAGLEAAELAGRPAVACEALETAGRVARQTDLDAAEVAFSRALAIATAHGLELWRLRALHELGTVDQLRTESVDRLREARDAAVELGAVALVATLDLQIAAGLMKQFRPDEGLVAARDAVDVSRRLRLAGLPMALVHQATAHAQRGEVEEAEVCLAEALALAPADLDVLGSAWGHCRATSALLAEDRPRALGDMAQGARFLQRSRATVSPPFLGLRVLLLAVDGDDAAARTEADLVRSSGATRHRIVASLLTYADAVLLGRSGAHAEAVGVVSAADAEMGPLVAWYHQYARRLTAEAALADGWGTPAAWLREAADFFASRSDDNIAAACRALLRRAGVPVPRRGRDGRAMPAELRAAGVTSREAEVLALVVEGLTNRELGARLHLSPRTVEKHVASLLAKTGCRRRAQLAGYSARLSG
jgi:DNA-binding CsgD family transcriptional regulator/tetratricopeptide (TPR) repeat protein